MVLSRFSWSSLLGVEAWGGGAGFAMWVRLEVWEGSVVPDSSGRPAFGYARPDSG